MGTQNDPSEESADVDVFGEPQDIVQRPSELDPMDSLPSCCTVLTCSDPQDFGREQTFYLVGTAHVSTQSCEDVRRVIRLVKPEVCALACCLPEQGNVLALVCPSELLLLHVVLDSLFASYR